MNEVEKNLLFQRRVWKEIAEEIPKLALYKKFPSQPPRRILLFGVGSSFFAAKLSAFSLIRTMVEEKLQPLVQVLACSSVSIGTEIIPGEGDWVIGLSHRGKTPATLVALEKCFRAGSFTALVGARGVEKPSFAQVLISTSEIEKCEPHTVGVTSAICAITTLVLGNKTAETWKLFSQRPNPDLKALRQRFQSPPTLLVGEWEGEWIAREIALKLTEMASHRCPVLSSEEFFHGPQVLSTQMRGTEKIWYISMPGDDRANQIQADYRTEVPAGPLAWIHSLVELQWLTLAVAFNMGKDPDAGHLLNVSGS